MKDLCAPAKTSSTLSKLLELTSEKSFLSFLTSSPTVSIALRAIQENFSEETRPAGHFSELYSIAAKENWDCSTRLEGRRIRLGTPLQEYKVQERGQAGTHFATTSNVEKSFLDSRSDLRTVCAFEKDQDRALRQLFFWTEAW